MSARLPFLLCFIAVFVMGLPAGATSQVTISSDAMEIDLHGRLHFQYNTTSVVGEPASFFLIRRARITLTAKINDFVSGRVQPDFEGGEINLKDAWVRVAFDPALRLTFGQFKRPFDAFELLTSSQILVIERAGGVRGVSTCAGPGGVCTFSRFTEKLQFSDRDIGIMADGSSGNVDYYLSITNGEGANTFDGNGGKSYTGRVRVTPKSDIRLGFNVGVHDYVNDSTSNTDYAMAAGADVDIGNSSQGLRVMGGVIGGRNWSNLDALGETSTFVTAQGIVTYRKPIQGSGLIRAVEPVGRVSVGDPDTDVSSDGGWLLTPGLVLHFQGQNKLAANLDVWAPSSGSTEWSFKFQSYLYF